MGIAGVSSDQLVAVTAAYLEVLDVYGQVLDFHAEVDGHFTASENPRIGLPHECDRDDYQWRLPPPCSPSMA
jgi:hypothetical protein